MTYPKVTAMLSPRTGKPVANQVSITYDRGVLFQSYGSTIAVLKDGVLVLGEHWNYSRTTTKYLNQWLQAHTNFKHSARELVQRGLVLVEDFT